MARYPQLKALQKDPLELQPLSFSAFAAMPYPLDVKPPRFLRHSRMIPGTFILNCRPVVFHAVLGLNNGQLMVQTADGDLSVHLNVPFFIRWRGVETRIVLEANGDLPERD